MLLFMLALGAALVVMAYKAETIGQFLLFLVRFCGVVLMIVFTIILLMYL